MIKSFKDKETERVFTREGSRWLPIDVQQTALRKLLMIHSAQNLQDLRIPPANRLEALKGNRIGQYSVRINDQWRITFIWLENNAEEVQIVDYH